MESQQGHVASKETYLICAQKPIYYINCENIFNENLSLKFGHDY